MRLFLSALLGLAALAQVPSRPVHTYSIVARDPKTGEFGVAVQSHWFNVGGVVPWAEAGVGAVATQSLAEPSYGRLGLDLMRAGKPAPEALKALLAADPERETRQVAMVDAQGRVAVHTGNLCIAEAGQASGEGFSCQANMMARASVWPAMARAFRESKGDLADRLLAALRAAEAEGGDFRGRQSAAILVVPARSEGKPWAERSFDLRVEDHPDPVAELGRLVKLQRAYLLMNEGDSFAAKNQWVEARRAYEAAAALAPHIAELPFWKAVGMVQAGHLEAALPVFKQVFAQDPAWRGAVRRLAKVKMLPQDEAVLKRIEGQ
ncbi:MAG: DUF1028 domain-containing protein [Acidobacteria bacterium]|nr:DUF1028 domain-containing protein [Acidobacteriota bacterium]